MNVSRDDGKELWRQFLKHVQPLKAKPTVSLESTTVRTRLPLHKSSSAAVMLPELPIMDNSVPAVVDKRLKGRAPVIEARLDLHGESIQQAYFVLNRFIDRSWQRGCHVVLVITGKSLKDTSKIRLVDVVPTWLKIAPLNQKVKKVIQARPRDGGQGALYVYLKIEK